MNIFTLAAKITLDAKEFEKGVKTAKENFSGLGAKAVAMGNLVADGVKAGGRALVSLGKTGVAYNSQMEDYTTNFKVMLGSTEAAVKRVEELKEMAAKTPFGMGDLAEATQTLLAFQVPAEKTNNVLKMLGDIALGDKNKLKGLSLVFGQVSSAGKLTGQDLMQFINQGFNPLNYIAQRTGESMEELRDRMSEGRITVEEIEQAFVDATAEGGQFHNGMDEASQTMSGLNSTLRDTINSKLGEFFSGVSEKIKEALPNVISFVENINVQDVKDKLEKMMQVFIDLTPVIAAATAATLAYKSAVAIAGIIEAVHKATEGLTFAQVILNAVMNANPFVLIATLLAAVGAALITLWHTNEDFRNAVVTAWESIKTAAVNVWEGIKKLLTETIPNAFTTFWNDMKAQIDKAVNFGKEIVDSIKEGISDAWDGLKSWFNGLWDSLFHRRKVEVEVETTTKGKTARSNKKGLGFVPYDEYPAMLHKGEAVLTARENREYRHGRMGGGPINIYLQTVPQSPAEIAAAVEATLEEASWA